jgi:chromosome partitioning protein
MRTIAITINKGGVGKTTLTKSIATAATSVGLNVLRRAKKDKPLPLTKFITESDLSEELQRAAKAGCDLVLIDTPPGRSSEAPAAVEAADLVLIPFWNDQDSYDGVTITAGLARRMGKQAYGVLNFATPNSRTHQETARDVLQAIGLPMASVVLHRYDAHRLANVEGLTAQELDPDSIAAHEVGDLWNWISAALQLGKGATVHKKGAA